MNDDPKHCPNARPLDHELNGTLDCGTIETTLFAFPPPLDSHRGLLMTVPACIRSVRCIRKGIVPSPTILLFGVGSLFGTSLLRYCVYRIVAVEL